MNTVYLDGFDGNHHVRLRYLGFTARGGLGFQDLDGHGVAGLDHHLALAELVGQREGRRDLHGLHHCFAVNDGFKGIGQDK